MMDETTEALVTVLDATCPSGEVVTVTKVIWDVELPIRAEVYVVLLVLLLEVDVIDETEVDSEEVGVVLVEVRVVCDTAVVEVSVVVGRVVVGWSVAVVDSTSVAEP